MYTICCNCACITYKLILAGKREGHVLQMHVCCNCACITYKLILAGKREGHVLQMHKINDVAQL